MKYKRLQIFLVFAFLCLTTAPVMAADDEDCGMKCKFDEFGNKIKAAFTPTPAP